MFAAAKEPVNHKEHAKKHLEEGARRVKKDAHNTADNVYGDLNSMAHAAGEHVREFVENASEGISNAKESILEATGSTEKQIHKYPFTAIALAAGVGLALGVFLRR